MSTPSKTPLALSRIEKNVQIEYNVVSHKHPVPVNVQHHVSGVSPKVIRHGLATGKENQEVAREIERSRNAHAEEQEKVRRFREQVVHRVAEHKRMEAEKLVIHVDPSTSLSPTPLSARDRMKAFEAERRKLASASAEKKSKKQQLQSQSPSQTQPSASVDSRRTEVSQVEEFVVHMDHMVEDEVPMPETHIPEPSNLSVTTSTVIEVVREQHVQEIDAVDQSVQGQDALECRSLFLEAARRRIKDMYMSIAETARQLSEPTPIMSIAV
jgi:hypothetical protein